MGCLLIAIIGIVIAALVGGIVVHPLLYGLFVAAIVIVPLMLVNDGIDAIFKKRKLFMKRQLTKTEIRQAKRRLSRELKELGIALTEDDKTGMIDMLNRYADVKGSRFARLKNNIKRFLFKIGI